MNLGVILVAGVLAQPVPDGSSASGTAVSSADPAAIAAANAALDAVVAKCADCHGPQLRKPKGKFGYVLDLTRVAAHQEYVVPGDPSASEFWLTIDAKEMPPDDAKSGPLTNAERAAIYDWIRLGAVAPSKTPPVIASVEPSGASGRSDGERVEPKASSAPKRTPTIIDKAVLLLGRFHVLVIHFPIGLLVTAAALEVWAMLRKHAAPVATVRTMLWFGAAGAIAAAGLGWLHALDGFPGPMSNPLSTMGLHRWLGTLAGLVAPLVAIIAERDAIRGARSNAVRVMIILAALLCGVAAHFGGLLTYGKDYFSW